MEKLTARDPAALAYAIKRSCENKAAIVALDEREGDVGEWVGGWVGGWLRVSASLNHFSHSLTHPPTHPPTLH